MVFGALIGGGDLSTLTPRASDDGLRVTLDYGQVGMGISGRRRPCSQSCSERTLKPNRAAKVRLALERRSITIRVTEPEREQLASEASQAGMLLTQYIRQRCGLHVRTTSLPGTDERENEADDAWERLKRLGLDARHYFEH